MEEAEADGQAAALAEEAHAEALTILDRLPIHDEARADLCDIAAFLLRREF